MASVASQMIEEVTARAQSDSLEDAREICADGTYFPNNLRICHTGLLTACEQDQDGRISYHCCVYSEKLLMMTEELSETVEFYSKNNLRN